MKCLMLILVCDVVCVCGVFVGGFEVVVIEVSVGCVFDVMCGGVKM